MSKQYLDKKKLETLKSKLNVIKTDLYTDFLLPIEDKYKKICSEDVWAGKKSDAFRESFQKYWYSTTEEKVGLSDVIANDFNNMIAFIDEAIKSTDKTDADSAKKMSSSLASDGIAKAAATVKAVSSNVGWVSGVSGKIDENPDADMSGVNGTAGGVPINVSVGGFYPSENNNENTFVAGLNYKIINTDGTPARANIGKKTIKISGKNYQVYTYDDPETPEKESYIIGALLEDGKRSSPTGKVYTIDYGNGDVYEFVDLDTNYTKKKGSERTPGAAMDTYVDILSVKGHAYNNVGNESKEPVKIADTGKTVSKK